MDQPSNPSESRPERPGVAGSGPEPGGAGSRRNPGEGESVNLAEAAAGDGAPLQTEAETAIWVGRTHWKHYAGRLMLWLAGNIVLAVLLAWLTSRVEWLEGAHAAWAVAGVFVISGLVVVGKVIFIVISHRYRLTSQRLFIERGILSRTIDQTELIRVDDVRIYKSMLDRIFGLGTVAILSTDTSDREVVIEGIPEADKLAESIRGRMRAMRRKSLFVENL